ncbi:MAG: hypothetical protein QW774_02790 [Candidatus Micrarchaeaceae archaeon]
MVARVYSCDIADLPALKKMLEYDPYLDKNLTEDDLKKLRDDKDANIIFARQDYVLKDGVSLNLDKGKYYLYINASPEFMESAEKKLKSNISSISRLNPEDERKVIEAVEDERSKAEFGFGSIFG